jgi:cytochrome c biogenesis protein ResB
MKLSSLKTAIWQALTNRTLSTMLLIAVTLLLAIGSLLPNPAYMDQAKIAQMQARHPLLWSMGEHYNNQKLVQGYFFSGIGVFLILSASLCSIDRLRWRRRSRRESAASGADIVSGGATHSLQLGEVPANEVLEAARACLRQRMRWAQIRHDSEQGMVIARRGSYGFWGSILFHSLLIMALVGMVIFHLGGTRGWLSFTEGQGYRLEESRFTHLEKKPVWGVRLPRVSLELLQQYALFAPDDPNTAIERVARFRVTDTKTGAGYDREVRINKPLNIGGMDFLLMNGGFAPRFVITGKNGTRIFDAFVNLREAGGTRDDFAANDRQLHLQVNFLPDYVREFGRPRTRSPHLRNPVVAATVTIEGQKLYDDIIPVGQGVQVADYQVHVPEVRRWVEMEAVNEPGIGFFFAVSFFGLSGLIVRMLDPDEQLTLVCTAENGCTTVRIAADSRHFPALLAGVAEECAAAVMNCQKVNGGRAC